MTLLHSTTALLNSSGPYFTLLHSTMALLGYTTLYLTLLHYGRLYLILLKFISVPWLYLALLDPTTLYHGWTLLDCITCTLVTLPWIYLALPHSTMPLLGST